jgi:hypothetical protein
MLREHRNLPFRRISSKLLLVLGVAFAVAAVAQTVTYPAPGSAPGAPKNPTVPTTVTQDVTTAGNCGPNGGTSNTTTFPTTEYVRAPFAVQGAYVNGLAGINWPAFQLPASLLPGNALVVVNGTSQASGSTFSPPTITNPFPIAGVTGTYSETYSASVSGVTLNEQWTGTYDVVVTSNGLTQDFTYTFVSSYNIVSSVQSFSWSWKGTQVSSGVIYSGGPCVGTTVVDEEGSTSVNWNGTNTVCEVNPADVTVIAGPPYSLSGQPTTMNAQFTPHDASGNLIGLAAAAAACGVTGFAWQQQVTSLPAPSPFLAVASPRSYLHAPPAFYDPPPSGYTYAPSFNDYPFYYPLAWTNAPTPEGIAACTATVPINDGNTLAMQDCPADSLLPPPPAAVSFATSLVGVLAGAPVPPSVAPGTPSSPYYTWIWQSSFNGDCLGGGLGGACGVPESGSGGAQLLSLSPVDPTSGTGGVVITSINGTSQTPPSVSCSATPNTLWPPNGKTVLTTISGQITSGTSAIVSGATGFVVTDSQSPTQQNGTVTAQSNGGFSFSVPLVASRAGNIKAGRQYTIAVTATDAIGNQGSCSALVVVPHDQGN